MGAGMSVQDPTQMTVGEQIDEIIHWCHGLPSRVGFFAALYAHVAKAIEEQRQTFEHQVWLEDVNRAFCARYLEAVRAYRNNEPATRAWQLAFEAARERRLMVVQHLLLGANAHINLDLAIATAQTIKPENLSAFENDFHRMNSVLGGLVDGTCRSLSKVWPFLAAVNRYFLHEEDAVIKFSLTRAREHAWKQAQRLVTLEGDELQSAIDELDARAEVLARRIMRPDQPLLAIVQIVRCGQLRSIPRVIDSIVAGAA
jgi:hypothetical protein